MSNSGSSSHLIQKASSLVRKLWLKSCLFHFTESDCAFPPKHPLRGQRPTHCWASRVESFPTFTVNLTFCSKNTLKYQPTQVSQGSTAARPGPHHHTLSGGLRTLCDWWSLLILLKDFCLSPRWNIGLLTRPNHRRGQRGGFEMRQPLNQKIIKGT